MDELSKLSLYTDEMRQVVLESAPLTQWTDNGGFTQHVRFEDGHTIEISSRELMNPDDRRNRINETIREAYKRSDQDPDFTADIREHEGGFSIADSLRDL